jgi:hypothetical protein
MLPQSWTLYNSFHDFVEELPKCMKLPLPLGRYKISTLLPQAQKWLCSYGHVSPLPLVMYSIGKNRISPSDEYNPSFSEIS